jgi:hypothetical protein
LEKNDNRKDFSMTEGSSKAKFFVESTVIVSLTVMSLFFFGVCCSFAADATPDLKGTWQAKAQGVAVGKLGHMGHTA